jgi:hypothetical protein
MTEESSNPKTATKALARLLRQLVQGQGAAIAPAGQNMVTIGNDPRPFPQPLVRQAQALGLVRLSGSILSATGEARSFLRRALLVNEEAFADQHRETVPFVVEHEGARQTVRRNLAESPLAGLARLKDRNGQDFFPADALDAGERLLGEFTRAQLQPRITASWEPRLSSRGKGEAGANGDIAATAAEARKRFSRAMDAMGPELSGVAADVCCFGKGLELVERERQWPARSAKLMLRTALLALARHYAPPVSADRRRSHHWGSSDYRPEAGAYGSSGSPVGE